jgi:hypothetical protein
VERPTTPARGKGKDKSAARGNKGPAAKDRDKPGRASSSLFNENMPNWTLRVVSDADQAVSFRQNVFNEKK